MTDQERHALMAIALLAAFADGEKGEREHAEIQRVAEALEGALPMAQLYRDCLLGKITVASAAADLGSPGLRRLAHELAVGVVEADGSRSEAETAFLATVSAALGLDPIKVAADLVHADALATLPLDGGASLIDDPGKGGPANPVDPAVAAGEEPVERINIGTADSVGYEADADIVEDPGAKAGEDEPRNAEIDRLVLNTAITNGALELLPQSLASMAVIPLQMKMVYRIGALHGYSLDRRQVTDLLATLGVGVTGQYLEGIGRRLLGGVLGSLGGGLLRGLGGAATGVAFSFATTWAIGQVARRYYASDRTLSADALREAFATLLADAKKLQASYAPAIAEQAKTLDPSRIVEMVRSA